jgi:5-hydroxyisourate hydrolase
MSAITTHILDVSAGRPAAGVDVLLERFDSDTWRTMGRGASDPDGRVRALMPLDAILVAATYRLTYNTGAYFDRLGVKSFYPLVTVVFETESGESHYHVPLLLSPFGYSTYRGS